MRILTYYSYRPIKSLVLLGTQVEQSVDPHCVSLCVGMSGQQLHKEMTSYMVWWFILGKLQRSRIHVTVQDHVW